MQQGTSYNSLKPILSLSISYSAQAQSSHQENPAQEGICDPRNSPGIILKLTAGPTFKEVAQPSSVASPKYMYIPAVSLANRQQWTIIFYPH